MIQCKIFQGDNIDSLQNLINNWLQSSDTHLERVKIVDTNQSMGLTEMGKQSRTVISIFYERVKK